MSEKIIVIPLASSIHEKSRWRKLFQKYKDILSQFNNIIFHQVLTNTDYIPLLDNPKILFLIHLTGGTSRLAKKIFNKYRDTIYVLVAHGFQNSLSSALSARQYIRRNGGIVKIIYDTYPTGDKINRFIDIASKILDFYEREIIIFTDEEDLSKKDFFKKLPIKIVRWSNLMNSTDRIDDSDVKNVLTMLSNKIMNFDLLNMEYLSKTIRLYCAMKKNISERSFVTVDCFNFIVKYGFTPCLPVAILNNENIPTACEADLNSLFLMSILSILGYQSWMANFTAIEDKYIVFTHCTASLNLLNKIELINHFETNNPYAVKGVLNLNNICIGRMNDEKVDIFLGKIVDISEAPNRCRVQIKVLTNKDPYKIMENVTGNHHVIFPSNALEKLKNMLDLLGIKVVIFNP